MSESDTDFELASENTRLMDGHVSTSGGSGDVRSVPPETSRKSKHRSAPPQPQYTEVLICITF